MHEHFDDLSFKKEKIKFRTWQEVFRMFVLNRKIFVFIFLSLLVTSTAQTLFPFVTAEFIERFFKNQEFNTIILYTIIFLVTLVLTFFGTSLFIYFGVRLEASINFNLRKMTFKKLQALPYSYYDRTPAGWIMARMSSDSSKVAVALGWQFNDLIITFFTVLVAITIMFILNWKIALIFMVAVPFLSLVVFIIKKAVFKAFQMVRRENSKVTASYNEGIIGIATTKSLVLEDQQINNFTGQISELRCYGIKARLLSGFMWPILVILGNIAASVILYFGGSDVLLGVLTISQLTVVINLGLRTINMVSNFAEQISEIQQAQAAAERVIGLLKEEVEIKDTEEVIQKYGTLTEPKRENWEPIIGDIEFKNVSFSYTEEEKVLEDFSLKVKKGEMIALVGATGGGKSTIVNLLCRFYEPTSGNIYIDGVDYKNRSLGWLRQGIGYVLQTPHLFKGTIKDNIIYGKLDATEDEVNKAAEESQVMAFANKFSEGLDYNIGEAGARLSLGERQLVSFARVLIKNPSIIILDEATASVDTETETYIKKVTKTLLKGKTSFVVAHRLSTIVDADKIVVIDNGKIVEMGTHRELLQKRGRYFDLCVNELSKGQES